MTAEQLEALAGGANPAIMGLDYDEVITVLARKVIAAEKLAEALEYEEGWHGLSPALREALTAYREASK